MKIQIICTGNTCRSQIAEGFLHSFNAELNLYSAGTSSDQKVNPYAVEVMQEPGIDIRAKGTESVDIYTTKSFDDGLTECKEAEEVCTEFTVRVKKRETNGFDDPAVARGSGEEVLPFYKRVRDEIKEAFSKYYVDIS